MCIKTPVTHFSQNSICSKRALSGLLHIRGIPDVIITWQQSVWSIMAGIFKIRVNNTNVGNFGKKIEFNV